LWDLLHLCLVFRCAVSSWLRRRDRGLPRVQHHRYSVVFGRRTLSRRPVILTTGGTDSRRFTPRISGMRWIEFGLRKADSARPQDARHREHFWRRRLCLWAPEISRCPQYLPHKLPRKPTGCRVVARLAPRTLPLRSLHDRVNQTPKMTPTSGSFILSREPCKRAREHL
jgi:hypothetical protein